MNSAGSGVIETVHPDELIRAFGPPCAHEREIRTCAEAGRRHGPANRGMRPSLVEANLSNEARVAERPVGIVGYADGVTQSGHVRPRHRAVMMLDLDLATTFGVVATMDEIAVLRAVRSLRKLPVHDPALPLGLGPADSGHLS